MKRILLFDMDGVLIIPHAYHRALRETVAILGNALGLADPQIDGEDIAYFEAQGVTSEWESSAICYALMLMQVWRHDPLVRLPLTPPLPEVDPRPMAIPDLRAFYLRIAQGDRQLSALRRAEHLLLEEQRSLSASQVATIQEILRRARGLSGSLSHYIFQELTLGADEFQRTYSLPAFYASPGYFKTDDRPGLSQSVRDSLLDWLAVPDRHAAVFTNRPSSPPQGFFDTPEAQMGLKLVGLEGFPLAGRGDQAWLADRLGVAEETYLKPSPVHALAALRLSLGVPAEEALLSAAQLVNGTSSLPDWKPLAGAQIIVLEDSAKGISSARLAADLLRQAGVDLQVEALGIALEPAKRPPLEQIGAQVFPSLDQALHSLGIGV